MNTDCLLRLLFAMIFCLGYTFTKSLNNTKTLINNLLANQQKYARPVYHQDDAITITVGMFIKSIQEFDEVQGRFSYAAVLGMKWLDVGMIWDPDQYGGLVEVDIAWKEVWTPELYLMNPAKEMKAFGEKWQLVKYFYTGRASWYPGALLETSCPVNSRNYPFDTQICTTSINALVLNWAQLRIKPMSEEVNLMVFSEDITWSLLKSRVETRKFTGLSQINFTFHLKRKPGFVIINVVLPILVLSLLNVLVFVLVPESGERVSFCITVLLAIVVFMTIVSDTLPRSSEPVPIISYKLMADLILSSVVTLVTMVNLAIYNKSESEAKPEWVLKLYSYFFHNKNCKGQGCSITKAKVVSVDNDDISISSTHKVNTITEMEASDVDEDKHGVLKSATVTCTCDTQVTWKDISRLVDRISLFLFLFLSATGFVIYILIVAMQ